MPTPKAGENQNDFISRCVPIVMNEGRTQDQALGKCYGIWREHKGAEKQKGVPKLDGSGKGKRENEGRGGCEDTEDQGKGRNPRKNIYDMITLLVKAVTKAISRRS